MVQQTPASQLEEPEMINSSVEKSARFPDNKECGGSKNKEVRLPFPCKVYDMLEDADGQEFQHIVSWNAEGTGFMVHNKDLFTKEIVPHYFNQTKYKSFQRQLSLYGFQRITAGTNKGLRYHEKLRRGSRYFCREMKPVGYKPRGLEQREKRLAQHNSEKTFSQHQAATDANGSSAQTSSANPESPNQLPAVVSYKSLDREGQAAEETASQYIGPTKTFSSVLSSHKLTSTDDIGVFEGMPFYLMGTPIETTQPTADPQLVTSSCGSTDVPIDGQMKKAWEIGFAVAMTMKHQSFVIETPCVDAVDIISMAISV
jgi:hypothetical protein